MDRGIWSITSLSEDKEVWPGDGLRNCGANGNCKEEEENICWSALRPSQKNAVQRKKKQS